MFVCEVGLIKSRYPLLQILTHPPEKISLQEITAPPPKEGIENSFYLKRCGLFQQFISHGVHHEAGDCFGAYFLLHVLPDSFYRAGTEKYFL